MPAKRPRVTLEDMARIENALDNMYLEEEFDEFGNTLEQGRREQAQGAAEARQYQRTKQELGHEAAEAEERERDRR